MHGMVLWYYRVSTSSGVLPPTQGFLFARKALHTLAVPPTFSSRGTMRTGFHLKLPLYVVENDLELLIFLIAQETRCCSYLK